MNLFLLLTLWTVIPLLRAVPLIICSAASMVSWREVGHFDFGDFSDFVFAYRDRLSVLFGCERTFFYRSSFLSNSSEAGGVFKTKSNERSSKSGDFHRNDRPCFVQPF